MIEKSGRHGGQLALSEGAVAVAVGRNSRTKNVAVHGLSLLSLRDGSVIDRLPLEGPCAGAAISKKDALQLPWKRPCNWMMERLWENIG